MNENGTARMSSAPASSAEAYESRRFWDAYNTLHYHRPQHAQTFANWLADRLQQESLAGPIRILVLGSGTGTVELPVLAALERSCNATFEIHFLERSQNAMCILRNVLRRRNWAEDPVALAKSVGIEVNGQQGVLNSGRFTFYFHHVDLDSRLDPDLGPLPSEWDQQLTGNFDLIFAAFTLFHLTYWHSALCRILRLMKPGALLLHPRTAGDESIWERNLQRAPHRTKLTSAVFRTLYTDPNARNFAERPKINTASFPGQITGVLQLLESVGMVRELNTPENARFLEYKISWGTQSAATYLDILETKGFGLFRRLHDAIGKTAYDQLVARLRERADEFDNLDDEELQIKIIWDAYRLENNTQQDLISHLGGMDNGRETKAFRPEFSLFQRRIAYQVSGFYADSHISSNAKTAGRQVDKLKQRLIQRLQSERLLHPAATIGQLFIDRRTAPEAGGKRDQTCFTNPYFALQSSQRMRQHIIAHARFTQLLDNRRHSTFSNIPVLLDLLMPKLGKPCVFRYHPPQSDAPPVTVEEEADFYLIGFRPRIDRVEVPSAGIAFSEEEGVLTYKIEPARFSIPLAPIKAYARELRSVLESDSPVLFELRCALGGDKENFEYSANLEAMAETIWALNPLFAEDIVQDVLFIPACYMLFGKDSAAANAVAARDLLILSYDRELASAEIAEEFERYNLVYDSIGLRRAQRDLASWVQNQMREANISDAMQRRVLLALDPLATEDGWMQLLYKDAWFQSSDQHAGAGAENHLRLLRQECTLLGVPDFPSNVESAKALFSSGKYSLPGQDVACFFAAKTTASALPIHLPLSPGVTWLRAIRHLHDWLVKQKLCGAKYPTIEFQVVELARSGKPTNHYAKITLPFLDTVSAETVCALNDGIQAALRWSYEQWQGNETGDFRQAIAGVVNGWFEVYVCTRHDAHPLVWATASGMEVAWRLATTEIPPKRKSRCLIVDANLLGWDKVVLPRDVSHHVPDHLKQYPDDGSKWEFIFAHVSNQETIKKLPSLCSRALIWYTRDGSGVHRNPVEGLSVYYISAPCSNPGAVLPPLAESILQQSKDARFDEILPRIFDLHPVARKISPVHA